MTFNAGILNDYGGGNVGWWHDYIRSLLAMADEQFKDELGRYEDENAELQAENKKLRQGIIDDKDNPIVLVPRELWDKSDFLYFLRIDKRETK
jgi:hypothetical protein